MLYPLSARDFSKLADKVFALVVKNVTPSSKALDQPIYYIIAKSMAYAREGLSFSDVLMRV